MRLRRHIAAVMLFFFLTQTLAVAGPVDEGAAAGNSALGAISGAVNAPSASSVVPGYTTSPPQTTYYNQPDLATQAQTALANCALTPTDPVCQAQTGAMASANAARPAISPYDPSVQATQDIANNPMAVLGDLSAYYSSCSTSLLSSAAGTTSKICHRYSGIGNYSCDKSLSVAVTRTPNCTPGDWFAHAQSGATGFDAQCLPDKPASAQHFRVTGYGAMRFFDVDMTVPILFPKAVADLGSVFIGGYGLVANKLWIANNSCSGSTCTLTALIAPEQMSDCAGGRSGGGLSGCTTVVPFLPTYAACPAGTQRGGNIQHPLLLGRFGRSTSSSLDDTQCYSPAPMATAYSGSDVTGTYSAFYWNLAGARATTGWTINPAWPYTIPQMTLSYVMPAMTNTFTDTWDDSCSALATGGRCTSASAEVCVDGPSTKTLDGVAVTRACWQTRQTYTCASAQPIDDCAPLASSGCTPAASSCKQTDPATGLCQVYEDTYRCPAPAMTTTTVSGCPPDTFCLGPNCFDTSRPPDPDFARIASMMEAGREAGVYLDADKMQVFSGESNSCRHRLIKNCCTSNAAGAGMTNQSVYGVGSNLVYDVLMDSSDRRFVYEGVSALLTGADFSGAFTSYGVTVAYNAAGGGATLAAVPEGDVLLASSADGSLVVAVDPYTLAIVVVIAIVMSLTSCNAEEGKLALKEGAGLCHTVGTYCSSRSLFGSCQEHTTGKCCFNSKLARIINVQGRIQVGKGWGSADAPDCSGFTIAQLRSLDFAAMDLSEFYASLVTNPPTAATMQGSNITKAPSCYYGQGKC